MNPPHCEGERGSGDASSHVLCVSCRLAVDAIRDVIQASTRHTGYLLDSECPLLEGRKGNQGVGVAACCVVEVASD